MRWYDNSIATAPERVAAAVGAFDEPLVLLLGGRDKDLPWEDLAKLVRQRVDHVVLFGEAAGKIERALTAAGAATGSADQRPYSLETVARLQRGGGTGAGGGRAGRRGAAFAGRHQLRRVQGL